MCGAVVLHELWHVGKRQQTQGKHSGKAAGVCNVLPRDWEPATSATLETSCHQRYAAGPLTASTHPIPYHQIPADLRVVAQVRFEAKALNDRQVSPHCEDWRARPWQVLGDMAAPLGQHVVYCCDAVRWRLDLHVVHWLHQAWRRHQEGRVAHTAGGGDDLTAANSIEQAWRKWVQDLQAHAVACESVFQGHKAHHHTNFECVKSAPAQQPQVKSTRCGRLLWRQQSNQGAAHLSSSSVQWLVRNERVCHLELHVADGLVTEWAFTRTPLETLHTETTTTATQSGHADIRKLHQSHLTLRSLPTQRLGGVPGRTKCRLV